MFDLFIEAVPSPKPPFVEVTSDERAVEDQQKSPARRDRYDHDERHLTRFTEADVTVVGLVGERGREAREFIEDILGEVTLDGNQQPIIGRRTTDSFVSARSGEVVVLGGLQRTVTTKSTTRLGPIPIIGDIFGSSTNLEEKQELVIFLRPYVLNSSAVDNLDALGRVSNSANGPEVKKIIDNVSGKATAAPAAPDKK